jgi:recombination associated protein RdgC
MDNIMWFKNIQIYSFTETFTQSAEQVNELLEKHAFTPISQLQDSTFGWVTPFNDSSLYCESVSGQLYITAQIQEKILPASVINDHLIEKLDEIESAEGRRPGKKEREQLKEDIRAILLPKAFHKTKRISAWIDAKRGWLVINASSEKTADDFTAQLREALGSLSVVPFSNAASGADILTSWYLDPSERPDGLTLEAELELTMAEDTTVKAKYKNLDLDAPEITQSLESGMRIRQLAMAFEEECQFVINEKFQVKRIKFQDKLIEQANDSEDPRSDAILMNDTLSQLILLLEPLTVNNGI